MRGLQTHFNERVDPVLLRELAPMGVQMARMDMQHTDDAALVQMVGETRETGMVPYVIVDHASQINLLERGDHAEPRNEVDLEGPSPAEYRVLIDECAEVARDRGVHLFAGAVSNFNARGFAYLRAICPLPEGVGASIHCYSAPGKGGGFSEAKVAEFRSIVGAKTDVIVSEGGYHTAPEPAPWFRSQARDRGVQKSRLTQVREAQLARQRGIQPLPDPALARGLFDRTVRRTDEQSTRYLREAMAFFEAHGFLGYVAYQLNDGVEDVPLSRYGIRRVDGRWKPQAEVFRVGLDLR